MHTLPKSKTLILLGAAAVLILVVAGAVWYTQSSNSASEVASQPATTKASTTASPTTPSTSDTTSQIATATPDSSTSATGSTTPSNNALPTQGTSPLASGLSPAISYVDSVDSDKDGLTDVEEKTVYHTDPNKTDTDGDGYLDGQEVKNLYDPTKPGTARLETSGLVQKYTNPSFGYSVMYPTSWVVKAIDTSNKEVLFTSATSEFFSLAVEDNATKLMPAMWYSQIKSPGADTSKLQSISTAQYTGVMTEDGLAAYFALWDGKNVTSPTIYAVTYQPSSSSKNEVNFRTTFQMFLKSLAFTSTATTATSPVSSLPAKATTMPAGAPLAPLKAK